MWQHCTTTKQACNTRHLCILHHHIMISPMIMLARRSGLPREAVFYLGNALRIGGMRASALLTTPSTPTSSHDAEGEQIGRLLL